jgi:hypothetical protein
VAIDAGDDHMDANLDRRSARRLAPFAAVIAALLATALFVTACNQPAPTPLPTTGVAGTVYASPTCPVEQPGQSPCIRSVAGAVIVALDSGGKEVARATSDAAGAYFLPLAPGTYTISPMPVEGLMGTAAEQSVTVTAGAPLRLEINYDTGIR